MGARWLDGGDGARWLGGDGARWLVMVLDG